jgi:phosphoribosylformimino-5-aminoimidazole carboxamide ribotide isomerase
MQIIPVVDLLNGCVVHAVQGNRDNYRAIKSQLCSTAEPFDVIDGYLSLFSFSSIYIADLNALEHQNDNTHVITSICNNYPNVEIWLDCGVLSARSYLENKYNNVRIIISSESDISVSNFTRYLNKYSQHPFILSLDFKADKFLGNEKLLAASHIWPKDIIVLNLNNVGSNIGYILPNKLQYSMSTKKFNLYYGGGIRNIEDVNQLQSLGFSGALISTALHSQMITKDKILSLSQ